MRLQDILAQSGIPMADGEILAAHALGRSRSWVVAHVQDEIPGERGMQLQELLKRRRTGEPIAYIVGQKEFFGRDFIVNAHVLIPRPATELLVEFAMSILKGSSERIRSLDSQISAVRIGCDDLQDVRTIVDIGTGSGCIAVTLAKLFPDWKIIGVDSSAFALDVAAENVKRHEVRANVALYRGSLLEPIRDFKDPFVVVSNPPYIPESAILERDVLDFEPHEALFSGSDGMLAIKDLLEQCREHPSCRGVIIECRDDQIPEILPT